MRNFITQLWLFWHGQHSEIWTGTFNEYYKCRVCGSVKFVKK